MVLDSRVSGHHWTPKKSKSSWHLRKPMYLGKTHRLTHMSLAIFTHAFSKIQAWDIQQNYDHSAITWSPHIRTSTPKYSVQAFSWTKVNDCFRMYYCLWCKLLKIYYSRLCMPSFLILTFDPASMCRYYVKIALCTKNAMNVGTHVVLT